MDEEPSAGMLGYLQSVSGRSALRRSAWCVKFPKRPPRMGGVRANQKSDQ